LAVTAGAIIPFVKINCVGAKGFYFSLDIMLKTSKCCHYANDAEDADRDTKEGKKSAEFILPQFHQSHFEAAKNNLECSAHKQI
jgi:hypothetical protein